MAYTNAHGVRAYVTRIMGLSSLFSLNISKEEEEFCKKEIKKTATHLDSLTKQISKRLIEE